MSLSRAFDSYSGLVAKKWKIIIILWITFLAITSPFSIASQHMISYSVSIPASNKESIEAENMISQNFTGHSDSNSTVYIILEGSNVLTPQFFNRVEAFNASLFQSLDNLGLTSESSVYSLELTTLASVINSSDQAIDTTKDYLNDTAYALQSLKGNITSADVAVHTLASNISTLNKEMYEVSKLVNTTSLFSHYIADNLTSLNHETYALLSQAQQAVHSVYNLAYLANETSTQLYSLVNETNQTAQLLYGVPDGYIATWKQVYAFDSSLNTSSIDTIANKTYAPLISQQAESSLYYQLFYANWYQLTFNQSESYVDSSAIYLATQAINRTAQEFASYLGKQDLPLYDLVLNSLNLTDFGNSSLIDSLSLDMATENLSAQEKQFVLAVFDLGPQPDQTILDDFALQSITSNMTPDESSFVRSAFYAYQSSSLDTFVIDLVASRLPSSTVQNQLNMSPYELVLYAFQLGNPPNPSILQQETASIASHAIPDSLINAIKNLKLNPYNFIIQVQGMGYPPNSNSSMQFVVSTFTALSGQQNNETYIQLLTSIYRLGENASSESELRLALAFVANHIPANEEKDLEKNFGLTSSQFIDLAAAIGYPENQTALKNLTVQLAYTQLTRNNMSAINKIEHDLNQSAIDFISDSYNIGYPSNITLLNSYTLAIAYKAIYNILSQDPILVVNNSALSNLISQTVQTRNNVTPSGLLGRLPMADMPVLPIRGIILQYVDGYSNATIITLTFESKPSARAVAIMEHVVNSFNSPDFKTYYTSGPIIESQLESIVTSSEKVALPIGITAAVIITGLFFMSPVAAFLPMLLFGISAAVGFGLIDIIIGRLEGQTLSFISPLVILILALGLVTDYSVLLLNRFRQELHKGRKSGARLSTRWAGEAVFTSGITVVLSYAVLSLAGIPLFSDVGSANIIMVSSVLAVSLTLLPSLMYLLGERIFWPNKSFNYSSSRLAGLTKKAIAKPKTVLALLLLFTAVSSTIAITLPVNINILGLTPQSTAKQGLDQITNNFGGNILTPTYAVVLLPSKISRGNNTFNQTELLALNNIAQSLRAYKGVTAIYGPTSPFNSTLIPVDTIDSMPSNERSIYAESMMRYISSDNSSVYFKVQFSGDPYSNRVLDEAQNLSNTIQTIIPYGYVAYVGGGSLDSKAVLNYVFDVLPKIVLTLIAAIFVVLLFQLRSVFTPLRLIATILSSVAWTIFFVWLIFYKIGGSSVFVFAPLFLVTTMLGLGMDYDIFLIVRVREEASKGLTDEEALVKTSESTASVIAALGFILSSVFLALGVSSIRLLQQIGITLAIGVLSDTFVVWLAFVPSIMILAKRLNWWPGDPRREGKREMLTNSVS